MLYTHIAFSFNFLEAMLEGLKPPSCSCCSLKEGQALQELPCKWSLRAEPLEVAVGDSHHPELESGMGRKDGRARGGDSMDEELRQ